MYISISNSYKKRLPTHSVMCICICLYVNFDLTQKPRQFIYSIYIYIMTDIYIKISTSSKSKIHITVYLVSIKNISTTKYLYDGLIYLNIYVVNDWGFIAHIDAEKL